MNSNFFFDKKNLKIRDIFSKVHAKDNFISNIKPLYLASKRFTFLTQFDINPMLKKKKLVHALQQKN